MQPQGVAGCLESGCVDLLINNIDFIFIFLGYSRDSIASVTSSSITFSFEPHAHLPLSGKGEE